MEQLVQLCGKKMMNANIIRSFLSCNSLFPVGSFVVLSNNTIGRVVVANSKDYMKPIVSMIWDKDRKPLPEINRINLLENQEVHVAQAIDSSTLPLNGNLAIGF
jgi:hypothetical protein